MSIETRNREITVAQGLFFFDTASSIAVSKGMVSSFRCFVVGVHRLMSGCSLVVAMFWDIHIAVFQKICYDVLARGQVA